MKSGIFSYLIIQGRVVFYKLIEINLIIVFY